MTSFCMISETMRSLPEHSRVDITENYAINPPLRGPPNDPAAPSSYTSASGRVHRCIATPLN
jgi:hypothetical protein